MVRPPEWDFPCLCAGLATRDGAATSAAMRTTSAAQNATRRCLGAKRNAAMTPPVGWTLDGMGARQGGDDDATNHVPPMMREMLLDRSSRAPLDFPRRDSTTRRTRGPPRKPPYRGGQLLTPSRDRSASAPRQYEMDIATARALALPGNVSTCRYYFAAGVSPPPAPTTQEFAAAWKWRRPS